MTRAMCPVRAAGICRTPTAETVARGLAHKARLDRNRNGPDTADRRPGSPPETAATTTARMRGDDRPALRARPFAPAGFAGADLFLRIDAGNATELECMRAAHTAAAPRRLRDHGL